MKNLAQSDLWRLSQALGNNNGHVKKDVRESAREGVSKVLAKTSQVFPLTLFPDELIIEELRLVLIRKNGPWSEDIVSIMSTDIASVNSSCGPFFGHIHVKSLTGGPEIMLDLLPRKDVFKVRNLIEGLAMSAREGLKVETDDLEREKESLTEFGKIT